MCLSKNCRVTRFPVVSNATALTPFATSVFGAEAAIGFLSGTTALIQGLGLYHFQLRNPEIQPYAGLGLGLLVKSGLEEQDGSTFAVTPVLGVTFYSPGASRLFGRYAQGYFIEYQGVDLFGISRIIAGLRWGI